MKFVRVETGTCSRCGRDLDGDNALSTDGGVSCLDCMTRAENIAQGERLARSVGEEYQRALRSASPGWDEMGEDARDRALDGIDPATAERLDEIIDLLTAVNDTIDELEAESDPRQAT